jgi:UDPglucose 6-dehydrogenase
MVENSNKNLELKVGFVGLGKLGLPVALSINNKGYDVMGYDVNTKVKEYLEKKEIPYQEEGTPELLKKHSIKWANSIDEVILNSDLVFCPVQTPHHEKFEGVNRLPKERVDFDYSFLKEAVSNISNKARDYNKDIILTVISTVLPGTIEREIKPLLNSKIHLAYSPLYIAMGTTRHDFENPEFSLVGVDDQEAARTLENFYKTIHNKPIFKTSLANAEAIKVFYNTFITSKILLANTWMQVSQKMGLDVDEITNALSLATDRILSPKYMRGGGPDSGGCHPRDLIALSWLGQQIELKPNWFEMMAKAREDQTEWTVDLIEKKYNETKLPVVVLGKAFKPETNLTVGSGATLLVNILKERGINAEQYDPIVDSKDFSPDKKAIYFIATEHKIFSKYNFPKGSVVFDLWRSFPDKEGIDIIKIGNPKKNTSSNNLENLF